MSTKNAVSLSGRVKWDDAPFRGVVQIAYHVTCSALSDCKYTFNVGGSNTLFIILEAKIDIEY